MGLEENGNGSEQKTFEREDEKALRNRDFANIGEKMVGIIILVLGTFISLGFLLSSIFQLGSETSFIVSLLIRIVMLIGGVLLIILGMKMAITFRKPEKVIFSLFLAMAGFALILIALGLTVLL